MKFMSKVSRWSSSALKLALAVGLLSLTGMSVQAQNQTVSGHLQVTGDTSLSGALNVTGVAELNSNITNFGSNGANAATPGLVLTYTDTASGTISTITMATSGTSANWQWERNSANGLLPQMTLTGTNSIILWNPTVSNSAGIILNPAGDSTFSGSITATGTNSRLPNQQISTDTASVLTKGYGDSTYLTSSQAASSYIPIGTSTLNVGYQTTATGSYSTALGYNTIAAGAGQLVIGQYNSPLVSDGDNSANWVSTDALFVIGNGTSDLRSNALVVSKSGDTLIAGSATVGKRLNVAGDATFQGSVKIPQQGDLSMGDFTNSALTRAQTVAEAYFNTLAVSPAAANISDTEKNAIVSFLIGLDTTIGLDAAVECWSLRKQQNAGSGNIAYGFLGKLNGEIVNSPLWGLNGMAFSGNGQYITIPAIVNPTEFSQGTTLIAVAKTAFENVFARFIELSDGVPGNTGEIYFGGTAYSGEHVGAFYSDPGSLVLSGSNYLKNNSNHLYSVTFKNSDLSCCFYQDGGFFSQANANLPTGVAIRGVNYIGKSIYNYDPYYSGDISFILIINKPISALQHQQIYQLYKSTIGQGLGLP